MTQKLNEIIPIGPLGTDTVRVPYDFSQFFSKQEKSSLIEIVAGNIDVDSNNLKNGVRLFNYS